MVLGGVQRRSFNGVTVTHANGLRGEGAEEIVPTVAHTNGAVV